jgi:class 3 adenylate cyclase
VRLFLVSSDDPQAQNAYFQQRLDELTGQAIKSDAVLSRVNRELRQRRQAFALLSELHRSITTDLPAREVYARLLRAVQQSLKMDRSAVLERIGDGPEFRLAEANGFDADRHFSARADDALLHPEGFMLATKSTASTPFITHVRESLGIAFFIAVPIVSGDRVIALLVSGRQREMKPFFPPLDEQDVNTMASLAGFLGSALTNARLFAHQRRMTESFRRFVPREFLEILGRESIVDIGIGEQVQRTMSILFSDIRSFTAISERMSPRENFDFINRYLEFVAPAVIENGGFIDKYIGDAIMALFPGDADSAVRGAVGLHTGLAQFNAEWTARGNAPIHIGAGIHTGSLMLGTVGFKERMDTTVIADAVNLASRMEGLTKQYGASVLITGTTRDAMRLPCALAMRAVDRVLVKGKQEPVEIVEVFAADAPELASAKAASLDAFAAAMAGYAAGNFSKAAELFGTIIARNPSDTAATVLAARCRKFITSGAPDDWQGVVAMEK